MAEMMAPPIETAWIHKTSIAGLIIGFGTAGIADVKRATRPRMMKRHMRPAVRLMEEGLCIMTGVYRRHRMAARTFCNGIE